MVNLNYKMREEGWQQEHMCDVSVKFLALFLNPLLAILFSCVHLKTKSSFVVLFITFLSFGAALSVPQIRTDDFNFDGVAYRNDFESYQKQTSLNFFASLSDYLSFEGARDFYADAIYFFTSRISSNYHLMFFVVSIFFSFFMLKSLKIFVLDRNFSNTLVCFILLYAFLINQILNINVFRFFTAAWLAIYSLLNLFVLRRRKFLLLLLFTPFFHASFFIIYALLLLYLILRQQYSALFVFYICSFFLSGFALILLNDFVAYLPPILGERLLVYINDDYMYAINESGSGFIGVKRGIEFLTHLYVNLMVFVMLLKSRYIINGTKCESLYVFLLLLVIFVNLTIVIPSVGSRFLVLVFPLLAYIWLVCFSQKHYNKYVYGLGIIMVLQFIMPFSIYLFPCLKYYVQLWDISFFIVPPFYSVVKYLLWC